MRTVGVAEAIGAIGKASRIVASPGCGTPSTLLAGLAAQAEQVSGSRLFSGLLLGDYPFLDAVREGHISYATWHVMPAVRRMVAERAVDFYPIRGSQVPKFLAHQGVDVALIRVSPPDKGGYCSLGPSVSYPITAVRLASLVIAEIDETLPRTLGTGNVHVSEIDFAVQCDGPSPEYARPEADERSRAIAKHLIELLPSAPTLQIGIGAIPEALVAELLAARVGGLRFAGMATDAMADLADAGLLDRTGAGSASPPILAAELMGSRRLMDFADRNPMVGVYGAPVAVNAHSLAGIDNFVSIVSAIEVDIRGQVNSEWAGGKQLTGSGGSLDFVEAAAHSRGGKRIVAFPATNEKGGSSKIVPMLQALAPVTIPRNTVEYVVTEYGVAHIAYASDRERAQALAAIAHPDHRMQLLATEVA